MCVRHVDSSTLAFSLSSQMRINNEMTDRLPPPRTLIVDFTLTHTRYGRSHVYSIGQLTNTRFSDGLLNLMVLSGR
jgi:hypothetical protein